MLLRRIFEELKRMVYCTKCGTLNPDTASVCSNCGAPLRIENRPHTRYDRRRYYEEGYGYHRRGNGLGLLITGLFILLIGLAALFRSLSLFWQYFWPVVLILLGVWLLMWGLRRNRGYRQAPPPQQSIHLFRIKHAWLHVFTAWHTKELY